MSARLHAATFDQALQGFQLFTNWWGGYVRVTLRSWGREEVIWRRFEDEWRPRRSLAETVRRLDEEHDDEIMLGLPWSSPGAGGVARASVLWVRVEGKDQLVRARRFRPLPSLVLQEGASTRRWLFWPLEETLNWSELKAANRKLAYALRAVQKHGDPDGVWFPAPGTCLRADRARPVPVRVGRLSCVSHASAGAVVGRLKEPPDLAEFWEGGARR